MKTHSKLLITLTVLASTAVVAMTQLPAPARAAGPWYVKTGGSDGNDCLSGPTACATINGAISKASSGDTILVATGTYTGTGTEVVSLNKSATLSGGWDATFSTQTGMSTIDGQNARNGMYANTPSSTINVSRFIIQQSNNIGMYISGMSITVQISQSTLQNNGLGILNSGGGGQLSVSRTALVNNTGNGIYNSSGNVTFTNSTISGNHSSYAGSAISNVSGNINIRSSTITNNSGYYDYAIWSLNGDAQITIGNSILAGNSYGDCWANLTSNGYNIFGSATGCNNPITLQPGDQAGVDPLLAPLQDNGGSTLTHALLFSPAINAGNPSGCTDNSGNPLNTDQRGFPRFGRCDIGAYELQPIGFSSKSVSPTTALPGDPLSYTITLSNPGAIPLTGVSVTDTLPISISYTGGSLTASSGSYGFASGVITWTGTLNATTSVSITFGAKVNSNAEPGSSTNVAVIGGGGEILTRTASVNITLPTPTPTPAPTPYRSYFPLIVLSCFSSGINGHVTFNGTPAAGVSLDLRFYNGSWSTLATTTTSSNGSFAFLAAPGLSPGQAYYVRYLNNVDPSRLFRWSTRVLSSYSAGTCANIGDFDIANIPLASPSPGAIVPLPQVFQWTRRPVTTSDSYEFDLFNPSGASPYAYTPPLGYVSGVTLNSLPSGFTTFTQYGWYVAVFGPDGGYGESYYYRTVTFSSAGSGPNRLAPFNSRPSPRDNRPGQPLVREPSR